MSMIDNVLHEYQSYFYQFLQVSLYNVPVKNHPGLVFTDGKDCYTNHDAIVIGKDMVNGTTMEETILQVLYILGHEVQHELSSPRKFWMWGNERGTEILRAELSNILFGYRVTDKDKDAFYKKAEQAGYHFTDGYLQQLVHFVFNSLEDGRIERIRCKKSRLFKDEMYLFRINQWMQSGTQKTSPLVTLLNNILSLATMGIYQKDYHNTFDGTPVDATLEELLPLIAKAVKATSCKACAECVFKILPILAPYILKEAKTEEDIKNAQKAMENSKQSGSKEGKGNSYSGDSKDEEKGEEEEEGSAISNPKSNSKPDSKSNSESSSNVKSDADSEAEVSDEKQEKTGKGDAKTKENRGANSASFDDTMSDKDVDAMIDRLRKEALEAGKKIVKDIPTPRKAPKIKEVFDTSAPVTMDILREEKNSQKFSFSENKRNYPLIDMPDFLAVRGKAFARKLEAIFERENIPELTERMSGSIDSENLYKIAIGEFDFYKKSEEPGELDTCAYFLVDNSGSMGSGRQSKRDYALQTCAVIEEGFKKYMPLKITAFDYSGSKVFHECVKNWEEQYNASCSYSFDMKGRTGSSNADGYSIRMATAELLSRPERQKILFVLSDGLPAYRNGEADTALAAKEARDKGIILIPVYFGVDSTEDEDVDLNTKEARDFAKIYQKDYIITIPEKVEDEVIRQLKKRILMNL